jgi:DNA-binding HxlR family transcriptional regulator
MNDLDTTLRALEKTLQRADELSDREGTRQRLIDLVHAMSRDGTARDLPVREIPARLGDRWSTLLMILLSTGTFRHATLRRLVIVTSAEGKISQRMLTLRLRTLERDGLVMRRPTNTHPPGMEYSLTDRPQPAATDRSVDELDTHPQRRNHGCTRALCQTATRRPTRRAS